MTALRRERQMWRRLIAALAVSGLVAGGGVGIPSVGRVGAAVPEHAPRAITPWTVQHRPTTTGLRGIACTMSGTCVVVGLHGTVLATSSPAGSWAIQHSTTTQQLSAVSCPGATMCYAVGGYGMVTTMTKGGVWSVQQSNTIAYLTGVACPSPSVCFAVGTDNVLSAMTSTIVATSNAGATWTSHTYRQAGGGSLALLAISCSNVKTCYAVGADSATMPTKSIILATVDGGQSWTQQTLTSPAELTGVTCPTATTCYAVGADKVTAPTKSYVLTGTARSGAIRRWTVMRTFTTPPLLLGVACPTADACILTGSDSLVAPTKSAVVVGTNLTKSGSWTVQAFSAPGPRILFGAACTKATCYAVGNGIVAGHR